MNEIIKGQVPIINGDKKILGIINYEIQGEYAVITKLEGIAEELPLEEQKRAVWMALEFNDKIIEIKEDKKSNIAQTNNEENRSLYGKSKCLRKRIAERLFHRR